MYVDPRQFVTIGLHNVALFCAMFLSPLGPTMKMMET
jgi:hypothetical protein